MKRITITFHPKTGGVTIATEGYEGATCIAATQEIERRLGIEDAERELTPEFHQTENQQEVKQ